MAFNSGQRQLELTGLSRMPVRVDKLEQHLTYNLTRDKTAVTEQYTSERSLSVHPPATDLFRIVLVPSDE